MVEYVTFLEMAGLVGDASVALARIARRHLKPRAPRRRNATLRPGVDTPLWLTVVATVRPYLRRRGEKALLARVLGVHPARIHEFFHQPDGGTGCGAYPAAVAMG